MCTLIFGGHGKIFGIWILLSANKNTQSRTQTDTPSTGTLWIYVINSMWHLTYSLVWFLFFHSSSLEIMSNWIEKVAYFYFGSDLKSAIFFLYIFCFGVYCIVIFILLTTNDFFSFPRFYYFFMVDFAFFFIELLIHKYNRNMDFIILLWNVCLMGRKCGIYIVYLDLPSSKQATGENKQFSL